MLGTDYVILLTIIAAAIVAYAQYVFKRSVPKFRFDYAGLISLVKNRRVVVGVLIYLLGLVFYLSALSSEQLSFVYPAFSSTFIFVILISHFMLNERIDKARIAGMLMIIIGIALVSSLLVF
jgi:drug/metabolite transporter (DMT)-like permease